MQILGDKSFLTADPAVINTFYSLDPLNVDSEDILVLKLDEYISNHKERIESLMPAIKNLRIPLVKGETIEKVKTSAYKIALQERAKHLENYKNTKKMKRPRRKITLLNSLPTDMIGQLYRSYDEETKYLGKYLPSRASSLKTKCIYSTNRDILQEIYKRYNHTLLTEYSDEDLKAILEVFKKEAESSSEFEIFLNYEDYLE